MTTERARSRHRIHHRNVSGLVYKRREGLRSEGRRECWGVNETRPAGEQAWFVNLRKCRIYSGCVGRSVKPIATASAATTSARASWSATSRTTSTATPLRLWKFEFRSLE